MSFGEPTDPAYISFREGIRIAHRDAIDKFRWRWHPRTAKWYQYPVQKFILDDVSVPDTSPGSSFHLIWDDEDNVEAARTSLWLPDLFARLGKDYAKYQTRWPHLVWTFWNGGDWRASSARSGTTVPPTSGETEPWKVGLNPECVRRVEEVREWMRRGMLPTVDGQRIIRTIIEECT